MIKKYLTCQRIFKHYSKEPVHAIRLGWGDNFIREPGVDAEASNFSIDFLIGEAADRLAEYEALGYTPEELRKKLRIYECYKINEFTHSSKESSRSPLLRPCEVNGEFAYFHRWVDRDSMIIRIPQADMKHSKEIAKTAQYDGVVPNMYDAEKLRGYKALVEMSDGTVKEVEATSVKFLDHEF